MRRTLVGGSVLIGDRFVPDATVTCDGERIGAVGNAVGRTAQVDVRGLLVLPGIVDLHADAVERAIEPRPGVRLPLSLALAEHDAWLLAAGITTSFFSLTDGFEPGLRSRGQIRDLLAALRDPDLRLAARLPLHLRREVCAEGDVDELLTWLATGRVGLLSVADHLPEGGNERQEARFHASLARRLGRDCDLAALVAAARARRPAGLAARDRLCVAARQHAVPLATHDDATPAQAEASAMRGVGISEFPADLSTARRARQLGAQVLMGAPNVVRGGSHIGCLGATEAVAAGTCDALCSDYHPASLLHAPFVLAARQVCDLATAWNLVSRGPAAAAGLTDRGRIAPGLQADLVLVEPTPRPRVRAVWVGGREVARYA